MYRYCNNCCCCKNNEQVNSNILENNEISDCGFNQNNIFPNNPMLAQSYVPIQYMNTTFNPYCGLKNGTIFPELATTYYPGQSMIDLDYLRMSSRT